MPSALIVGAGINGLATARALVLRGWKVTMLEAGPLPNPDAASWDHHRVIRGHYAGKPHLAARIGEAFAAWDRLFADLGERHYHPRGVIALSRVAEDWTDRSRTAFEAAGLPFDLIEPHEVAKRFPMFESDGVRFGLATPDGGALMSGKIVSGLIDWLTARGVTIHAQTPVTKVHASQARVDTSQGRFEADRLVVAAGVGLMHLSPHFAGTCHPRRVTVLYVDVPEDWRAAWAEGPVWIDLGGEDDLWGIPPVEGLPLKLGYGAYTVPGDPETERTSREADITTILDAYRGRIRGIERCGAARAAPNFYLMAPDEDFQLIEEGPTLWLSADSGHGFKFGALTGEDVADAIEGEPEQVRARWLGSAAPLSPSAPAL